MPTGSLSRSGTWPAIRSETGVPGVVAGGWVWGMGGGVVLEDGGEAVGAVDHGGVCGDDGRAVVRQPQRVVGLGVLVEEPEGLVVGGVDGRAAVVAPALLAETAVVVRPQPGHEDAG